MDVSSVSRIFSGNTGIDPDAIVKKLMTAERAPQDALKRKYEKLTWQSEAYRQWNKDLYTFRTDTLFNMKLSKTYNTFDVSSSFPNAVSSTATVDAIAGSNNLMVKQLAESATITGNNVNLDTSKALGDATQGTRKLAADSTFNVQVFNDPENPTSSVSASITIKTTDTIADALSKINTAKDASGKSLGLQAMYDKNLQQFIVKTKATGESTKINFSGDTTALTSTLGINTTTASGKNANITFNGQEIKSLSSNTFTLLGVEYTLKGTTKDATGNYVASTMTVSRNVDDEVKNIKDFVSKYNDLLDKLNTAVDETVYPKYQPLTDDERSSLTDSQIEKWEKLAKSGLMRRDGILSSTVSAMRNITSSTVDNGSQYNSLSAIGISSRSYSDKGKLYIDEKKLRDALKNDPDAVENLFTQTSDTTEIVNGTDVKNGLVNRLYDAFSDQIKSLTTKAGATTNDVIDQSVIGKLLKNTNDRITSLEKILQKREASYYSKFTKMEQAMNKMGSQSSWFAQQTK